MWRKGITTKVVPTSFTGFNARFLKGKLQAVLHINIHMKCMYSVIISIFCQLVECALHFPYQSWSWAPGQSYKITKIRIIIKHLFYFRKRIRLVQAKKSFAFTDLKVSRSRTLKIMFCEILDVPPIIALVLNLSSQLKLRGQYNVAGALNNKS